MGKIETLNFYISNCDLENQSVFDHQDLINEITMTYHSEISNLEYGLSPKFIDDYIDDESVDPIHDLKVLKLKLENHRDNLMHEDQKRAEELKILELKSQITINNNNHNTNNSNSSASAVATITINQTMKNINELPEGILSREESVDLKELIHSIDEMISEKDNEGAKSKISKVLCTIGNKGFDLFVAVAPYLIQAATTVQATT
ncbi:MAG: hypothetical protein CVU99_03345 [Firmicutes bacterium HGW-Firmicutes-4]|jgi:hypothetical protein|nr:MAG: hypothetical protein CVV25_14340 [Ignavibacteriae bacterium HGW-Ignavibacteriae-4]PKM61395.1 MAG: hypothetical protein CVU99_03345 [Firmicutes bacterium HGW-Firmicutes-4]